jgi:hypothetical protein
VLKSLLSGFLELKLEHGSAAEQAIYSSLAGGRESGGGMGCEEEEALQRLLTKRPLAFLTAADTYLLKNGASGAGGFDAVGSDAECFPLLLRDCLSYDEMQLASLVGISSPTHFINSGSRGNCAAVGISGSYEPCGIVVAQVGARFERSNVMEFELCAVTETQNTEANGYGSSSGCGGGGSAGGGSGGGCGGSGCVVDPARRARLQLWAQRFFGWDHMPSFYEALAEVSATKATPSAPSSDLSLSSSGLSSPSSATSASLLSSRFVELSSSGSLRDCGRAFLDVEAYRRRAEVLAEVFLAEANARAAALHPRGSGGGDGGGSGGGGGKSGSGGCSKEEGEGDGGGGAFCHVVGLGLGVWQVHPMQALVSAEAYASVLRRRCFPHVSDLYLAWFPPSVGPSAFGLEGSGDVFLGASSADGEQRTQVAVHFGKRNPADPLLSSSPTSDASSPSSKLLVTNYAWDSNAYPGNEYWLGQLSGSGDPAAACSSTIAELQNPDVNPDFVCAANAHVVRPSGKDSTCLEVTRGL